MAETGLMPTETGIFNVDLEGFEGPLDLLLDLAKKQKIDLSQISILKLSEQYLFYLDQAQQLKLEIAAEYLVMAAWLAYLKSQLLLPKEERDELDPDELASQLAQRLRKLDALRAAGNWLMQRPVLGDQRRVRGVVEEPNVVTKYLIKANLGDLLAAYGKLMSKTKKGALVMVPRSLATVEAAISRMSHLLNGMNWHQLEDFLPNNLKPGLTRNSAIAAALLAGLELGKLGIADIEQKKPFGPINFRKIEK